jgi:tRNA-dihydrouridine synthase
MAGRAAVRAPWIFAEARAMERRRAAGSMPAGTKPGECVKVDIEGTGLRFLELLARHQPPEFHISRARRFFSYFCDNLTWAHYLKTKLNREETLQGIERVWRGYWEKGEEGRS